MENPKEPSDSFVDKLAALVSHEADECPVCSEHVEYLVQLDGYVYAQPCVCRLWQGNVPPTWWDSEMYSG
jgi:hypothetical protein